MKGTKRKRIHPFLLFFIILMCITLLLLGTAVGLWLYGRSALTQSVQVPTLPAEFHDKVDDTADDTIDDTVNEEPPEDQTNTPAIDQNIIVHNGKQYLYNENMCNILLLGIDSDLTPNEATDSHDQADVLLLGALDLQTNQMTLIYIPRDIVCNFEVPNENGDGTSTLNAHLALAYAYGGGRHESCRVTCDAVSNIFYGLPIHGYGAYYMQGISALNDAVGGVTVTILDDYPFPAIGFPEMIAGREVTLNGEQAVAYIRSRLETQANANELRILRQKQYMLALLSQAKNAVIDNPLSLMDIYSSVQSYVLTDLDLSRITYLAAKALSMDFSGDIISLTGELSLDEQNRAVLTLDQESLYSLMLDVFYTELP